MYDSMSKEQRVDILKLADFLDCLPPARLKMVMLNPFYGSIGPKLNRDPYSVRKEIECGTSCCVIGWAAILNQDRWEGFKGDGFFIGCDMFSKFFGMHLSDTTRIGYDNFEYTPQQKAQEIRRIVKDNYIQWEE